MATNTSEANRFLGVSENSVKMTLALPQEEVFDIQNTCMQLIVSPKATIIELIKLLGKPSFISRENSLQVLATTTNSGSETNKFLSNQNKIKPTVNSRVEVVEGEFISSKRQTTDNRNATVNNPNGCFQNKLGGQSVSETPRGELGHIRKGQNISM